MRNGYIYLYRDSGYDLGVKIGYDSSVRCKATWTAAPSYSPREMLFIAAWEIPDRLMIEGQSLKKSRENVEILLHRKCGQMMCKMPEFPRTGRDWCWISAERAQTAITEEFAANPCLIDPYKGVRITNDNLRNPHPRMVTGHRFKVVLWVYRELHTGLLKTQFIDDWSAPRERARRYSRNGFEEVAAYTYDGLVSAEGNAKILSVWSEAVSEFGHGSDDHYYGWLRQGTSLDDLLAFYDRCLPRADAKAPKPPLGVRTAYNRSEVLT